jgi:hypothetical protein
MLPAFPPVHQGQRLSFQAVLPFKPPDTYVIEVTVKLNLNLVKNTLGFKRALRAIK